MTTVLRSVLYMPGANDRALEKAKTIPCDGLILDLEDSVAPDAKPAAREAVCAAASSGEYGRRTVTIRVNSLGTVRDSFITHLAGVCYFVPTCGGLAVVSACIGDDIRVVVAVITLFVFIFVV